MVTYIYHTQNELLFFDAVLLYQLLTTNELQNVNDLNS